MHPDSRIAWQLHSIQPAGLRSGEDAGGDDAGAMAMITTSKRHTELLL
jgi:hypothetical protein